MRHRLLLGAVLALLALPATGHAQSGGASPAAPTGGAGYGVTVPRLVASRFALTPATLKPGAALGIRYRVDGTRQSVRVRVDVLPVGSRHPAARIRMGWKRTGRTLTRTWTPPAGKPRPAATSRACTRSTAAAVRCAAPPPPRAARVLTVLAAAPEPAPIAAPMAPAVGNGVFPVQGTYTYGDRFGVKRGTATHRGQASRRRGHADRHPARRRRHVARLPGPGRRQLPRDRRRRRP